MSNQHFDPGAQHPDQWRRDLNPDALAGQNYGVTGEHPENYAHSAYDYKDLHERMPDFNDADLKAIPVLPQGSRLEQGAKYIDLNNLGGGEFAALGNLEAGPENLYVAKSEVDYLLWNRLIGVTNPARLDQAE